MTRSIRVAGWGTLPDGSTVTWTVSEGRRGRRWREVVSRGTAVVHALLLETDPDGRFSHLELARADGLWTFHPERDGSLHGNHVGGREPGVRHVAGWPFAADDAVIVDGSPLSLAATAWHRATSIDPGGRADLAGVVIRSDAEPQGVERVRLRRLSATRWQVGEGSPFDLDEAGLPVLVEGARRPLELA